MGPRGFCAGKHASRSLKSSSASALVADISLMLASKTDSQRTKGGESRGKEAQTPSSFFFLASLERNLRVVLEFLKYYYARGDY